MFKPLTIDVDSIRAQASPRAAADENATSVFKVLHGFYGNLFLSKFASGQVDNSGADEGVTSAKGIWAHGLRKYSAGVVKAALNQCLTDHPKFPPSLPEFVAMCAAHQPRETYRPATPALAMSSELRSQYAAQARAITERHAKKQTEKRLGADCTGMQSGLDGLKQAIANAVANANGDEVRELRRLDFLLAPKTAAA